MKVKIWDIAEKKMNICDMSIDGQTMCISYINNIMYAHDLNRTYDIEILRDAYEVDRNNIPIFEGDILKDEPWASYDGCPQETKYSVVKIKDGKIDFGVYYPDSCEIIGNIYENPDLLDNK